MLIRFRLTALLLSTTIGLLAIACGGEPAPATPEDQEDEVATLVAETLTAIPVEETEILPPTQTPEAELTVTPTATPDPSQTPTASPTPIENNVSGAICFPEGDIPAMTAFFEETDTETLVEVPIDEGQISYEVKLEPGTYIAYAWLADFSRGGLYSRAVPCGLNEECDDHNLLPFRVNEGEVISGIDLCDWFAGPFNVPYPPGKEQSELTGSISGALSYIEEPIPGLRIVAFNLETNYWYWVSSQEGQTAYTLAQLPPGTYQVIAYDAEGRAGGHARADHSLIEVTARSGETTEGVDINDWDAPEGSFPEDPTR
jgi:hypothetical protein